VFTGIIEEVGIVQSVKKGADSSALTISGAGIFSDLKIGDSVAVEGVCLTAASIRGNSFTADVMHETLNRSTIGRLKTGNPVNLERAMPATGRFGGHIVSGHIDGTGTIAEIRKDDNALLYKIKTTDKITEYIVEKGSIAIDGISLTVTFVTEGSFGVSVIPHTAGATTLSSKPVGTEVNLENDIIGKYVEKLMGVSKPEEKKSGITMGLLAEYGYTGG